MSFRPLLQTAFVLSEMVGVDYSLPFWGVLLVLVAVAVMAWRYGLRWVRRKQQKGLVAVGVLVLVVALASSLLAYQLFVTLVFE